MSELTSEIVRAAISELWVKRFPVLSEVPPDALSAEVMPPHFCCPVCGMTSFNTNDIREGYCGNCHDWTNDLIAPS